MSGRPRASSSVWVPRAVKQAEREQQTASRAVSVPAQAPSVGTARASDLDDLDDDAVDRAQPESKRAKLASAPAADAPATEPPEEAVDPAARREALEEEVVSGGPRLAQHIKAPSKCIKVAAMAYSLLEQGAVTPRNSSSFFLVLEAAMEDPMRPVRDAKYRVAYRRLFEEAAKHRQAFSAERQQQLDVWLFMLHASLELVQADDSYAFSRTSKRVLERLERLRPDVMPPGKSAADFDDPGSTRLWTQALACCLETAFMQYKHPWARPSVDALVKLALASRKQWSPDDARRIEEWNQLCKSGAVRKASGTGGGGGSGAFMTSFDRDAARWRAADVSVAKKKEGNNVEASML